MYGRTAAALIYVIGRRITETTGESRGTHWQEQRLGLLVQRGNALSILRAIKMLTRLPDDDEE